MRSAWNSVVSRKISASGLKVIRVPVPRALPMTSSFFTVLPRSKAMWWTLIVAGDLDLEPFGDGVDALGADAVGAAGELVAALAVLAAGVEVGEHHLDGQGCLYCGWMSTGMPRPSSRMLMEPSTWMVDLDAGAMAGEVFVDGVVEDLGNAVVQGALIGAADVHAGLLAHGLEAFELAEFGGIVGVGARGGSGAVGGVGRVGHEGVVARVRRRKRKEKSPADRAEWRGFFWRKGGAEPPFFLR
jgi:hypothetical protein